MQITFDPFIEREQKLVRLLMNAASDAVDEPEPEPEEDAQRADEAAEAEKAKAEAAAKKKAEKAKKEKAEAEAAKKEAEAAEKKAARQAAADISVDDDGEAEEPGEDYPDISLEDLQEQAAEILANHGRGTMVSALKDLGARSLSSMDPENYKKAHALLQKIIDGDKTYD